MHDADPPEKRGSYRPPIPGRPSLMQGPNPEVLPPPERRVWTPPLTIGVLADTHMPGKARELPPPVVMGLRDAGLILHAGDVNTRDALDRIRRLGPPLLAVRGNTDAPDLHYALPVQRVVTVGAWRIGLTHGDGGGGGDTPQRARRAFSDVHCVIFGHNHQPMNEMVDGVLLFNPGSPTDRRRAPTFSYGILRVTEDGITGEIVRFQRD